MQDVQGVVVVRLDRKGLLVSRAAILKQTDAVLASIDAELRAVSDARLAVAVAQAISGMYPSPRILALVGSCTSEEHRDGYFIREDVCGQNGGNCLGATRRTDFVPFVAYTDARGNLGMKRHALWDLYDSYTGLLR